jgi:hypothetical protein
MIILSLRRPRLSHLLFSTYIAVLILLPSGTIRGINFKILLFIPLIGLAAIEALKEKNGLSQILRGTIIIAAFAFWIFLAQIYEFYNISLSFSQYKDIVATLLGCWFVRLFTKNIGDHEAFVKFCIYLTTFLGTAKIAIFVYALGTGNSISSILDFISRAFGVQLMTFDMADAFGRIQFPSDTLIPCCLFAVFTLRRSLNISAITALLMAVILSASAIFSFSRFLWGCTVLSAALALLISKRDRVHWLYIALCMAITGYYGSILFPLIQLRFSQQVIDASDPIRVQQSSALKQFFLEAPLLGHGLGSFTNIVIREVDLPYNYEMQLVALFTQIGITGIIFLACLLVNYYKKAFTFSKGNRSFQFSVLILLATFIAGSLFNPSIISSIAAATFGFLFCLCSIEWNTYQVTNKTAVQPNKN